LTDHVFLEEVENLLGFGQVEIDNAVSGFLRLALFDDFVAQLHAFITDVYAWSGD
jgi:hypothetical protein